MTPPANTPPPGRHIGIGRHGAALAVAAALGFAATRQHAVADLRVQFALLGSLHALSVAAALLPRPRATAIARVMAATGLLNATTVGLALTIGPTPRLFGVPAAITMSAAVGAAAYALLLRATWFGHLRLRECAALACACALATSLAARWALSGGDGLWRLSLAWWLTFSAILCYLDRRAHTASC
jgi:hypothetical protein